MNFAEFNIALNSRKSSSAPGKDGINCEIINNIPLTLKLILVDIYNEMYFLNDYPDSWKETFVHFIEKSNDNKLRPIALTSCLCKLFEIIHSNRLQWWFEYYNIIPNCQSGIRRGKSCEDNLASLTLTVEQAFESKKHVLAVFLDVAGAFPSVVNEILLEKFAKVGCSKNFVQLIHFITYERHIYSVINKSDHRKVFKGIIQGGAISALSYIVYVSEIMVGIPKRICISQFADDISLYIVTSKHDDDIIVLNQVVNTFSAHL